MVKQEPEMGGDNLIAALKGALMVAEMEGTRQALTDAGMMLEWVRRKGSDRWFSWGWRGKKSADGWCRNGNRCFF